MSSIYKSGILKTVFINGKMPVFCNGITGEIFPYDDKIWNRVAKYDDIDYLTASSKIDAEMKLTKADKLKLLKTGWISVGYDWRYPDFIEEHFKIVD